MGAYIELFFDIFFRVLVESSIPTINEFLLITHLLVQHACFYNYGSLIGLLSVDDDYDHVVRNSIALSSVLLDNYLEEAFISNSSWAAKTNNIGSKGAYFYWKCFITRLVHVQSGDKFCDHWPTNFGEPSKVIIRLYVEDT
ncbi:hypothetical protein ACSBR2_028811 [Camellia fascicularis]